MAGHRVVLVGVDTRMSLGAGPFGLGASYLRPTHVEVAGEVEVTVPDVTMRVRLAVGALLLLALAWRLLR